MRCEGHDLPCSQGLSSSVLDAFCCAQVISFLLLSSSPDLRSYFHRIPGSHTITLLLASCVTLGNQLHFSVLLPPSPPPKHENNTADFLMRLL